MLRGARSQNGTVVYGPSEGIPCDDITLAQYVDLLQSPDATARPVEPISKVPPGILVQAVDERNGWYLVDTNLNRGWAPTESFDEP